MKNKSFIILSIIATVLVVTSTSLTLALKDKKDNEITVESDVIETKTNDVEKVIKLSNLDEGVVTGSATIEKNAYLDGNSLSNYTVSFFDSLDTVEYTFDIVNNTDDDMEISDINFDIPSCLGLGENGEVDASKVCSNIKYQLLDSNGEEVGIYDSILKGESKTIKAKITFNESGDENNLPETTVEVNNLDILFSFQKIE